VLMCVCVEVCMCGFCNVWMCVSVGGSVWVLYCVGVCMCGFCKVVVCVCVGLEMCVCMCGFCNVWVCLCVGFVMCDSAYVWVL